MKVDRRRKVLLICLAGKMKQVGATYGTLAKASGVDIKTIYQALQGRPLLLSNGIALMGALNTRFPKQNS